MTWCYRLAVRTKDSQSLNRGSIPRSTTSEGNTTRVSLAQLVEQLTLNQWVEGSSPSGDTKRKRLTATVSLYSCRVSTVSSCSHSARNRCA